MLSANYCFCCFLWCVCCRHQSVYCPCLLRFPFSLTARAWFLGCVCVFTFWKQFLKPIFHVTKVYPLWDLSEIDLFLQHRSACLWISLWLWDVSGTWQSRPLVCLIWDWFFSFSNGSLYILAICFVIGLLHHSCYRSILLLLHFSPICLACLSATLVPVCLSSYSSVKLLHLSL